MHLNCALVSSFLFVSAVLAGYHPEKQQPPFLDRIEKSNNTTDLATSSTYWAGAVWQAQAQGIFVDFAAGTFTVPSATQVGSSSDSFEIGVGLNGYAPCSDFTLGVGIDVIVTADRPTSYQAWGRWSRGMVKIPAVKEFDIFTGNNIRAIVLMLDPTSGVVILINYATRRVWAEFVTGRQTHCKQDAAWVISTLPDQPLSFPNFGVVGFTGISARISAKIRAPNARAVNFKQQDGRDAVRNVIIEGAYVIIVY